MILARQRPRGLVCGLVDIESDPPGQPVEIEDDWLDDRADGEHRPSGTPERNGNALLVRLVELRGGPFLR